MAREMTTRSRRFLLNLSLCVTGILSAGSGFLLQFIYHMGHGRTTLEDLVWDRPYAFWSMFHKLTSLFFVILIAIHLKWNWKWIKRVVTSRSFQKHREVFVFTAVFGMAAVFGFTAWMVSDLAHTPGLRECIVEVHDKITLVMFVFLCTHIWKRKHRI